MKAYWINATEQTISEVSFAALKDLQRLVGGYIEVAVLWPNGDTLYVDEEGLLKSKRKFWAIPSKRKDQPFAGNGVLVGREIEEGDSNLPPTITLDQLRPLVKFLPHMEEG